MGEQNYFGSSAAILDEMFVLSLPELRRIAAFSKRVDQSFNLNVTALVNEAYIKLRKTNPQIESLLHLRLLAGRAMRFLLVDAIRQRYAESKGGKVQFVSWDDAMENFAKDDRELMVVDAALSELASEDARQSDMVVAHFFGGLNWNEVAELFGVSKSTVEEEWRCARARLRKAIAEDSPTLSCA